MSIPFAVPAMASLDTRFTPTAPGYQSVWDIAELGAVADGKTDNTKVIQAALDSAAAAGGTVHVPPGTFMTGSLRMGSRTTLYLSNGAVLLGSPSVDAYKTSESKRGSGKHLIFAKESHDLCIAGEGTIDGNCVSFRGISHRTPFAADQAWLDVAIFDWKPISSFASMVQFTGCSNVTLRDVTLRESPRWTVAIDDCDGVRVDGIRIRNVNFVPETDGIDIVCSRNVLIHGCDIATADDAVCIKSDGDGDMPPTRNIIVANCMLTGCCNGFKIGTGTKGHIQDVLFTDSIIYNTETPPSERIIGAICIEMVDGGTLDGVKVSGIQIRNARVPLFIRLGQRSGKAGTLRNVSIEDVDVSGSISASSITGIPGNPVQEISIRNLRIHSQEEGEELWSKKTVPELVGHYPEALMFERLPAYGLYVRHVQDIRLDSIDLKADSPDQRPALVCDDVEDIELSSFRATPPQSSQPTIAFNDCRGAFLHGLQVPPGTAMFLNVTGPRSSGIRLAGNDLSDSRDVIRADNMGAVKIF